MNPSPAHVEMAADLEDLLARGCETWRRAAVDAIAARGRFTVALAGGSTPRRLHEALATAITADLWSRTEIFWGDERMVPPDDIESNFRMARESLLDRLAHPPAAVHRMRGELAPAASAEEYAQELTKAFGAGVPRLDLVWLGVGPDGHTASIFPGTAPALHPEAGGRLVLEVLKPGTDSWRTTLTLPVLNSAREVVFLAEGEGKAEIIGRILGPATEPELPAAMIRPEAGATWLIDPRAAARLPGRSESGA